MTDSKTPSAAHVWRVSAVVVIGSIMSILDTTIVNVALATLSHELHATISEIQWVVTGYMLSLAAVIPITGWAARRFGAKQVYLLSLVLFTAGSALCGLATSTTELIVFRVLQGVGGGMILPVGQLMMAEAAGPKRMGRVMSIVAVPAMLAPILGPTLGGADPAEHELALDLLRQRPDRRDRGHRRAARAATGRSPGQADRLDVRGLLLMATGLPLAHLRPGRGGRHRQLQLAQGDRARSWPASRWWPRSCSTRCACPSRCSTCACTGARPSPRPRSPCSASARRCSAG